MTKGSYAHTVRIALSVVTLAFFSNLHVAHAGDTPPSCTLSDGVLEIDIFDSDADSNFSHNAVRRDGDAIEINNVACAGATVKNTDTIRINDADGGGFRASISLGGGRFTPGMTAEEKSSEIEIHVSMGGGENFFSIYGDPMANDNIRAGITPTQVGPVLHLQPVVNLNAGENAGIDGDLTLGGTIDYLNIWTYGGSDTIDGTGGAGTGPHVFSHPLRIEGLADPDVITGGSASDTLKGEGIACLTVGDVCHGEEDDIIKGGAGEDFISGEDGADTIIGGTDDDAIQGGDGGDTVSGSAGADSVEGHAGRDNLKGNGGNDSLAGGAGGDALDGGKGSDNCAGGVGEDVFSSCESTDS